MIKIASEKRKSALLLRERLRNVFTTILAVVLIIITIGCGNNEGKNPSQSDSSAINIPDSNVVETESELKTFNGLPVDSFYLRIKDSIQKIYGVRDGGELVFEGDIKFSYPEEFLLDREIFMEQENLPRERKRLEKAAKLKYVFGVGRPTNLWPVNKNGIIEVPFVINQRFADSNRVKAAIGLWENSHLIKFVPFTNEKSVVEFISSENTRSNIGRISGYQSIEIDRKMSAGNIAHEIGHVLGLFHEQCRSDRDKYLRILCANNIDYMFAMQIADTALDVDQYNLYSIMHYRPDQCMKCLVTPLPKNIPGQRDSVTRGDIAAIKFLYNLKK